MNSSAVLRAGSDRSGIQSVEVAGIILNALTRAPAAVQLKDLAEAAGMKPAKLHRYLVSLMRTGLVEQNPSTGRYDIGPLSLTLGLAALGRVDVVRSATEVLPGLRDAIGETAVLAIWGERGPTVIRFEESSHPVTINVRVGSTLPVLRTALGMALAAFSPPTRIDEFINAERADLIRSGASQWTVAHVNAALAEVRAQGLARITGDLVPGVAAMAAPVRDHLGVAVATIGAIGRAAEFDLAWNGPIATALRETASQVSARLGCPDC
jgi:DNA-binding IclR family transcriptional regulator